jgi:sugar lactone lactonase YvrE
MRVGNNPTLLASSDFPLTVGTDGSLYYIWVSSQQVQIYRLAPSGKTTVVKTVPAVRDKKGELRWRNGITISADGSIYYSEDKAIRKITPRGELSTVISNLSLPDCGSVEGVEFELGPYYRGLAVDTAGNVYVAATGCRAVLKITPDKRIMTVLQASSPWSPTAVALSGKDLYVLEYLHTANESRRDWIPRVRKVLSDGNVVTIATVERR